MTTKLAARALPIGLLSAAAFLSAAGARVIDPLLHVVATDFSTSIPEVSIVITAFTLPYGLNQLFLGPIGDKFGKLRVLLAALLAYAVATGLCALAGNLATLTVLRACAGAASAGLIPVGLAYIGDAVAYQDRQLALSRFLTGAVVAQVMAGPIGGIFGDTLGWRGVFVLLSGIALVVAAALALRIRRLPDRRSPHSTFQAVNYRTLIRWPTARHLLIAAAIDGMTMAGSFPFLAPFLRDVFEIPYWLIGLLLACFGIGAWIYIRCAARIIRTLGEPGMVLVGGLLMAAGLVLGMAAAHWWVFAPVELMLGLGYLMLHAVLQARATELLPEARATAVSSFVAMLFLGQALGAAGIGALIALFDYRAAFLIDAALVLALSLWLRRLMRHAVTP